MPARRVAIDDPAAPALEPYTKVRERDLVGRERLFVAEGEVVVRVLAERSRLRVRSLLIEERRVDAIADVLARLHDDVDAYVVPQRVMDAVVGFSIHRGILALGERGEEHDPRALVRDADVAVGLVGLTNHDNVGGIFRSAAAFAAGAVLLDDATCDPLYRKSIRVSAGAALLVPFARARSAHELVDLVADAGLTPIALTPRGEETITELPRGRYALLLGTEGPGLPADVLARTRRVRIDMPGKLDSLNVAVAGAIALHAVTSRR
ncbi:MAG: RNA methyltransferase [Labilithrix sp.]|nr:RNA methyltransferase [Labilithrix sp.]MCW5816237.1 RNA methyltransferase [Labilithrix sp.]